MSDEENEDDYDDHIYFTDCTCDHEPEQHGWGHCEVENCNCEGGWEE